jgi:hypothetical protein
MNLLDYAFYMHWRQFEMLWSSLASKLGFRPLNEAIWVVISATGPPTKGPFRGPWQLKIGKIWNALVGLCFLPVLKPIYKYKTH